MIYVSPTQHKMLIGQIDVPVNQNRYHVKPDCEHTLKREVSNII